MSIVNRPGQESYSLNEVELMGLLGSQNISDNLSKTRGIPALEDGDPLGATGVYDGSSDETAIDEVMTAEQQEFSSRLLELCGDHPVGGAIVSRLRHNIESSEDPWRLAEEALKILYAGQEDCLPHVQPYFYDKDVIQNIFYGDKGLFLRFLGRGGFGSAVLVRNRDAEGASRNEVWKIAHTPGAYDGKTQRWHSVEGDATSESFLERLNREADATEQLGKLGVAPELLERGTIKSSDGKLHPYFSTKFVPGMTLKQLITAKRVSKIPSQLTADVGVLFGVQLGKAHKEGFVHRDTSKANLYFKDDGTPIILDWGLSYHDRDNAMTRMGAVMGTPEIMSPEVATGGTVNANRESDVYSLSVVLHEMQTGQHLFGGENGQEVINKHARAERDLSALKEAKTPQAVINIISDAISIDRTKRPDAEKLARLLWPHSSLYLAHGKIPFDEFLAKFDTLGRLQLPATTEEEQSAIPSKFGVIDPLKKVKGKDDLAAESSAVGSRVNELLIRRSTDLVRRDIRNKLVKWVGGLGTAAAIIITAANSLPTKPDLLNKPLSVEVKPDPNAPIKQELGNVEIESDPSGEVLSARLFKGMSCEIQLSKEQIVAVRDDEGKIRGMTFRMTDEQGLKFLGYEKPEDFPPNDDQLLEEQQRGKPPEYVHFECKRNIDGKTVVEKNCVTIFAPNGDSVTYFGPITSYLATTVKEDGSIAGTLHSARYDISDSVGDSAYPYAGPQPEKNPVIQNIIRSFPLGTENCTRPNSPVPRGGTRKELAGVPNNFVKSMLNIMPRQDGVQTASNNQ